MGLFDIFKKKEPIQQKVEEVKDVVTEKIEEVQQAVTGSDVLQFKAVTDGEVVDLSEVPDPAFAQKMVGDGFAVKSSTGLFCSPVDAEVALVFPTKHAVGLKTSRGDEIIIHVGLDTVSLDGEPFEVFVAQGDKVVAGDKLIQADLKMIEEKGLQTVTPVVVSDMTNRTVENVVLGNVKVGDVVADIVLSK